MTLGHFSKDLIRPPVSGGQSASAVLQNAWSFYCDAVKDEVRMMGLGRNAKCI